jgi:hypothetical protein
MAQRFYTLFAFSACVAIALGTAAARADDGGLKGIAEALGLAAPSPPPPPFVVDSRPAGDLGWIPVFTPPPEPKSGKLTPKQLQAQQNELEGANKSQDNFRNAFPPSAKALAEQRAQQAREAAKKRAAVPATAATPAPQ